MHFARRTEEQRDREIFRIGNDRVASSIIDVNAGGGIISGVRLPRNGDGFAVNAIGILHVAHGGAVMPVAAFVVCVGAIKAGIQHQMIVQAIGVRRKHRGCKHCHTANAQNHSKQHGKRPFHHFSHSFPPYMG